MCGDGHDDSIKLLNLLENVLHSTNMADVCATSLQSWGLIMSTLSKQGIVTENLAERLG